ncbi:MAG: right-handed parallel beta-helix repeat-containing protein, partial [Armatimonadota bacterium]
MNAADWRMLSTALLGALMLAGLLCGSGPARAQQTGDPAVLHVAPHGNDAWSGRLAEPNEAGTDGPLATLEGARNAVRDLRAGGTGGPVRVLMHEGVYELPRPLVFEAEDGGTDEAPVRYEAAEGEEVTLRGSRGVVGWEPWRGEIWRADLVAQGLEGVRFHQLFHGGRRQTLARHPNADPGRPRTGGFIYVEDRGPTPAEQFIYAEGDIPFGAWEDISQAEVWTVFGRGWNFALTPIAEVDRERRIITTRRVRRPFERMNRYFIQNVLGALDEPGEWFLDYETSVLYYWPPDGRPQDGEVRVPVLDSLIEVAGSMPYPHGYLKVGHDMSREQFPMPEDAPPEEPVEHLWFRGLRLEEARQDGFRLTGARRCEIVGCTVTNVGNVGINLGGVANAHEEVGNPRVTPAEGFSGGVGGGGQNLLFNDPCMACRVIGCDVYDVGSDGIFLYGDGNQAENNHVFNSGLFDKDGACINLWGEENVARRNHLHDVPRNAVFLKGARNVVELNEIHHTMLETCDGGAIRMCQRNLALRGNVIAHNRIVDTIGYGYPGSSRIFQSPYYSWGVYLDDFTCGTRVLGNIIVRTGRGGPMLHGGSDNLVANNIIVDAGDYGVEIAPIRDRPVSGNRVERNVIACDGAEAWVYRCTRWVEGAVSFSRNLVWTRGEPARV